MATSSLNSELITAWQTARARIRNYRLTEHGGIHAALRPNDFDPEGEPIWEYTVTDTSDAVLKEVADAVRENPDRLLIVAGELSDDSVSDRSVAERFGERTGLTPIGVGEKMMITEMINQDVETPSIPEEFQAEVVEHDGWYFVEFTTSDSHSEGAGQEVARGRVAVVDEHAVFDQIWTSPNFRRQGMGSLMMRYLSSLALESLVEEGLLIAGSDGQGLYTHLGWKPVADIVLLGHPDIDRENLPFDTYQS